MTPDCFVCPLTSLRGAVVNQALHVRGKQKGGEGGGLHFLCKKWGPKGSSIHPLCTEQKVGSLREARRETKTHVHIQTWQRFARVNELGWSSQGVGSYYAHCAVGQLKLFGCFFWSYIYQTGAGGLALQAGALLCPHCRTHVCAEMAFRYLGLNSLKCWIRQKE